MKAIYRHSYLLSMLILISGSIIAQEKVNTKEFFIEAESYFLFEEYSEALPLYQRILRVETENFNVMFKVGMCYLNDPYQKEKSIQYLSKASKNINPAYKTNTYKEKLAPPETNYYLGLAYRVNGNIQKALEYYKLFKSSIDPEIFDIDVVKLEIDACERALQTMKLPVYFTKENIGEGLNSRFTESNAVISGNGKSIVFNRALQFYDAVFISTKDENGEWGAPYNLTPDFGLDGNSYCTGISYTGDEIFVYRSDNFDGNIYSSKRENGKWSILEKLDPVINTKYWESHASPSADGKTLYFTSNRKGGYGGLDIYKSERTVNGKWGEAINLGPVVNSELNENTPFVSANGQKLFFSSFGHSSIGGYDIFVSTLTESGKWASPENMGYPFNTADDDIFFCPLEKGPFAGIQTLYDPSSAYGLDDIYWISVYNEIMPRTYTIKGQVNTPVQDLTAGQLVEITLVDNKNGKIVKQVKTDDAGNYSLEATQGEYQLLIDGDGIKPISVPVMLSLTQEESFVEIPLITAQIEEKREDEILLTTKELPKLELQTEEYVLTDSTPVSIDLLLEKGSSLKIETYNNKKFKNKEEYLVTNEKFSFILTPEPGENTVVFEVTGKEGNISTKEVKVYYKPRKIEEPIAEEVIKPTQFAEVALITGGGLSEYLSSLKSLEYSSLSELYQLLLVNANENNYSTEDVENLMARMLTQRDMDEFLTQITEIQNLEVISSNDSLKENISVPIAFVRIGKQLKNANEKTIDVGLIEAVPFSGDKASLAEYILSFLDYPVSKSSNFIAENYAEVNKSLNQQVDGKDASQAIELASTTISLETYYHNLLLSADGDLTKMLANINFDSLHINNSIDLVNYLLANAEKNGLSKTSVAGLIEKSRTNQKQNIFKFKEALAKAAKGELKLRIQEIDIDDDGINELSDIVDLLLRDSKTRGYGRSEVYNLLISMIGIEDIDVFINELLAVSEGKLDAVLAELQRDQYSLPIEVLQFLLSQAPYYDYSDSDINNLLLKMLLEKGIDNWKNTEEDSYSSELIKKRRFKTTIVLINLLLLVVFILMWRKKRK
jgi:hypothetical protein